MGQTRNRPKRHHFVPICVLKGFVDAEGFLHFRTKSKNDPKVQKTAPGNLFKRRHYHSTVSDVGEKDPTVEEQLAKIEGDASQVLESIVGAVTEGEYPKLDHDKRAILDYFIYLQWRRTPDAFANFAGNVWADNTVKQLIAKFEQEVRPLTVAERQRYDSHEVRERLIRNSRVDSLLRDASDVTDILKTKQLSIARMPTKNSAYIIGGFPVVKLTPPETAKLEDPTVEVWFPISSEVSIGYVGHERRALMETLDTRGVHYLNMCIAKQSTIIAARSPRLVASLTNRYW